MNDAALLRNLSKSNAYDVTQQHSDDEEYDNKGNSLATVVEDAINDDDEGNPLATVVKDAINDDDDGGGSALQSLLQQLSLLQLSLNSTSIG
jgi:hypothetical protein